MSSLTAKLVSHIDIKSDGDAFHKMFTERPHHLSDMSPALVQSCHLHDGDWGKAGSVISWKYTHDGKAMVAKDVIEAIDEANKFVAYKVIEGDLMELYKTMKISIHVETGTGEDHSRVTWTLEYEKLNEDVPDPHSLMEFCLELTKDIETHHLSN